MVASGEFSNIKNNPIAQRIVFKPVKGKEVSLKCVRTVDDILPIGVAGFSVITE